MEMVVGVCGIGYTGSGAIEDLLREYTDIQGGMDDEFNLLYIPDGILDLEYHLCKCPERFFSSDVAIKRFVEYVTKVSHEPHGYYNRWTQRKFYDISMEYVEDITQMKWKGYWYVDEFFCSDFIRTLKFRIFDRRIIAKLQLKRNKKIYSFLDRKMYLSIKPEDFEEKTKKYLANLFEAMGYNLNDKIFVNQLFAGNNPTAGMQFFDNPRAIVVERDPRDLYMLIRKSGCVIAHWYACDTVEEFVEYYRCTRRGISYEEQNTLWIQFEDLVYHYEETLEKIEGFLDIHEHVHKKRNFNPEISINNTQLFDEEDKDIQYIEKMLPEYLYDFSGLERPELNEQSVF